jgi:hypothetical protein
MPAAKERSSPWGRADGIPAGVWRIIAAFGDLADCSRRAGVCPAWNALPVPAELWRAAVQREFGIEGGDRAAWNRLIVQRRQQTRRLFAGAPASVTLQFAPLSQLLGFYPALGLCLYREQKFSNRLHVGDLRTGKTQLASGLSTLIGEWSVDVCRLPDEPWAVFVNERNPQFLHAVPISFSFGGTRRDELEFVSRPSDFEAPPGQQDESYARLQHATADHARDIVVGYSLRCCAVWRLSSRRLLRVMRPGMRSDDPESNDGFARVDAAAGIAVESSWTGHCSIVWSLETGQRLHSLAAPLDRFSAKCWLPSGAQSTDGSRRCMALAAVRVKPSDLAYELWDVSAGVRVRRWRVGAAVAGEPRFPLPDGTAELLSPDVISLYREAPSEGPLKAGAAKGELCLLRVKDDAVRRVPVSACSLAPARAFAAVLLRVALADCFPVADSMLRSAHVHHPRCSCLRRACGTGRAWTATAACSSSPRGGRPCASRSTIARAKAAQAAAGLHRRLLLLLLLLRAAASVASRQGLETRRPAPAWHARRSSKLHQRRLRQQEGRQRRPKRRPLRRSRI